MGGDITLTVPENFSMDIDIELAYTKGSWKNYRINSDFDLNIEKSPDWVKEKGSYRKYIYGRAKIGNGRNSVRIKTVNGHINLKKETK